MSIEAKVDLGMNEQKLPTLAVTLHVYLPGLNQSQAEDIVAKAHQGCPYSRATQDNIDVTLITTTEVY